MGRSYQFEFFSSHTLVQHRFNDPSFKCQRWKFRNIIGWQSHSFQARFYNFSGLQLEWRSGDNAACYVTSRLDQGSFYGVAILALPNALRLNINKWKPIAKAPTYSDWFTDLACLLLRHCLPLPSLHAEQDSAAVTCLISLREISRSNLGSSLNYPVIYRVPGPFSQHYLSLRSVITINAKIASIPDTMSLNKV
jgi:hypothetical protein